jgi:hypothetical protein
LSGSPISIAFVIEGQTVRLGDPNQWRAAVKHGDLTPMTRIVVAEDGGQVYSGPASGYEGLKSMFQADEASEHPPVVDDSAPGQSPVITPAFEAPAPTVASSASAPDLTPNPAPELPVWQQPRPQRWPVPEPPTIPRTATAADAEAWRAGQRPLPPPKKKNNAGLGCLVLIVVLAGAGLLLSRCAGDATRRAEVRYAETQTVVTDGPDGAPRAMLNRGDTITVLWPRTGQPQEWLQVQGGRLDGGYVRQEALSDRRRPTIVLTDRTRTITTEDVRVRADPAGEPLDVVNTGDQVREIGVTENGWSEIEYGQGVAYVATRYTRAPRR